MAPGVLCNFQVLSVINLNFFFSFLVVFTEGHLTIIIGATEAGPTTTLLIDRVKSAQYTHTHTHMHTHPTHTHTLK